MEEKKPFNLTLYYFVNTVLLTTPLFAIGAPWWLVLILLPILFFFQGTFGMLARLAICVWAIIATALGPQDGYAIFIYVFCALYTALFVFGGWLYLYAWIKGKIEK